MQKGFLRNVGEHVAGINQDARNEATYREKLSSVDATCGALNKIIASFHWL